MPGEGGGNGLGDAAGGVASQKAKAEGGGQQEEILKGGEEGDVLMSCSPRSSLAHVHTKHIPSAPSSGS